MQCDAEVDLVCREFGCTPMVAERELEEDAERVFRLIEYRRYAAAKRSLAANITKPKTWQALNADPYMGLVQEHTYELKLEHIAEAERAPRAGEDDGRR